MRSFSYTHKGIKTRLTDMLNLIVQLCKTPTQAKIQLHNAHEACINRKVNKASLKSQNPHIARTFLTNNIKLTRQNFVHHDKYNYATKTINK